MNPVELAKIHAKCFAASRPWSTSEFASLLQDKNVSLFSNEFGFLLARHILGEVEILTLAVHPDHQRLGHAKRLHQKFEEKQIQDDAHCLFLEVSNENKAAINLYETLGYLKISSRKNYYSKLDGTKTDAIVMSKKL